MAMKGKRNVKQHRPEEIIGMPREAEIALAQGGMAVQRFA
jgi:hypothetical protein